MAVARFSFASEAVVGSREFVEMGGVLEAIERRRLSKGSEGSVSIVAIARMNVEFRLYSGLGN